MQNPTDENTPKQADNNTSSESNTEPAPTTPFLIRPLAQPIAPQVTPEESAAASSDSPEALEPPAATPSEVTWEQLGLSAAALETLQKAGYARPTPIQAQSIPLGIAGKDLIASAQTGTGKTASFTLPLVERFAGKEGTFGLILAPTREIAQQTQATIELLGGPRGIRSISLIGGIDMKIDAQAIQSYPQIIVATPGRLCDHIERGNIWLEFIKVVVLDEADRMLDMGFADQLNRIFNELSSERQTMVFSATFPPAVEKLAKKIMNNPIRVAIGKPTASAPTIDQRLIFLKDEDKIQQLFRLLREESGSIIVFTRSKDGATRVWRSLHSRGVYDATYIHSDRLQAHREQALAEFKEGKYRILIATDVAGRGIHVDDVAHVVNYDLPLEPEDYIHRVGRTGRKGASGKATSFATSRDRKLLTQIETLLGRKIPGSFKSEAKPQVSEAPAVDAATEPTGENRKQPHSRERQQGRQGRGRDRDHRNRDQNRAPQDLSAQEAVPAEPQAQPLGTENPAGSSTENSSGDGKRRRGRRSDSGAPQEASGQRPASPELRDHQDRNQRDSGNPREPKPYRGPKKAFPVD